MTRTSLRTESRRLAFVTPRYGAGVVGGSESVMREAAHGLAARGHSVDVLTTCARDHYTWANEFPAGAEQDGLVTVRRFEAVQGRDLARWVQLQERLLGGATLSEGEELEWINGRFRIPDLYLYLAGAAREYDAVVFSPYLFWSTLYCVGLEIGRAHV